MIITVNTVSDVPIYLQICNQIIIGISDGHLKTGEQLPSVRALAQEIGINSMTVNKAYQLLKQDGYIVADRRKGARICEQFQGNETLSPLSMETLKKIISEAKIKGITIETFLQFCTKMYGEDQPGKDQYGENQPGKDQYGEDQPGKDQQGADQQGADQPSKNQQEADKYGANQNGEELHGAEQ